MTPEELESLSPEERDALQDAEQDQELRPALEETESETQPEVAPNADADGDAPVEEVQSDGNEPAGDADGDAAPETSAATPEETRPAADDARVRDASTLSLQVPQSVDEIDSQLAALQAKMDDGALDFKDFLSQRDALQAERWKASIYQDLNQQFRKHAWEQAQHVFYQQHPEIAGNPILAQAYTGVLQGLLETPEGQALGDVEVLALAKTRFLEGVQALFGETSKPAAAPAPKDAVQRLKQEQQGKKTEVKTLAGVPAAEAPDVGKDPFSHLDTLDGAALEAALAKLSPDQVEKYLMSQ